MSAAMLEKKFQKEKVIQLHMVIISFFTLFGLRAENIVATSK